VCLELQQGERVERLRKRAEAEADAAARRERVAREPA
jgi:hypothetical protein